VGTANTAVLIASSVSVIYAWASLKLRKFSAYRVYMALTILCGLLFLTVKLTYEWPAKFHHFGVFIKQSSAGKYEEFLGNTHLREKGLEPRWEVSGHLLKAPKGSVYDAERGHAPGEDVTSHSGGTEALGEDVYVLAVDAVNAQPDSADNERPVFWPRPISRKVAVIKSADVESASPFVPRHSTYFATYFLITGLHGLHVLGGIVLFVYLWLPFKGGAALYNRDPEHLANRVEVAGLFWHFVDLVWIFVFPIFYLL
jgi:cytochrome c oxidase subunit 3